MRAKKVKVNVRPYASHYQAPSERIIEFSHPNGGGLISFRVLEGGKINVSVYRTDGSVDVSQDTHLNLLKTDTIPH